MKNKYRFWLSDAFRRAPRFVQCCKTRVAHKHSQVSRGGILKVASERCGAESTHSKLRLRLCGKRGLDFNFNLKQKTGLKSAKWKSGVTKTVFFRI